ncbi:peroxidase, family 2 domain-containing protein [Hirsutella rhossiliensis]|uniref:Peroxidase, family 2 domain-containing protein n=1 Tax=Hirsutella rhossiliensis TaxID=111463 RepID=A0A9P8MN01_9HYPO|nr:peroxidase, family 2 domain-containing protein [Hirsutella rhossiliensis]KAH0958277.1 peroxidase, family 2 domain-containing protein [Hirsutella rhossiliensis]
MRAQILSLFVVLSALLNSAYASEQKKPTFNPFDRRFFEFRAARPSDSRGPCPALNALANHGFLPRDGRDIGLIKMLLGTFLGFGLDPVATIFIWGPALVASHNPLTLQLDLEDLSKHNLLIEHDCSYSREDYVIGDNNNFNPRVWAVARAELRKHTILSPISLGRAKSARIRDARRRNPRTVWGPRAAGFSLMETGTLLGMAAGFPKYEWVRCIFEEERLPTHLGWRAIPLLDNGIAILTFGIASLLADPDLLQNVGSVVLDTPADIFGTIWPPQRRHIMPKLRGLITELGFNATGVDEMSRFANITFD